MDGKQALTWVMGTVLMSSIIMAANSRNRNTGIVLHSALHLPVVS